MNHIFVVIKKELARFFGDKRMVFTTILMPGLMIYMMYTLMGDGMMKTMTTPEDYVSKAYVQNMPAELEATLQQMPVEWTNVGDSYDLDAIREELKEGEKDGFIIFPTDFIQQTATYNVASGEQAPNVAIYYNSAETNSGTFYSMMKEFLNQYEESIANRLDVNGGEEEYDCATESDVFASLLSKMLPMLIMTFLFSGCMAAAPESIAGEKERGTIATLLVTPVPRSALALGKIVSLSIIASLSGLSSFIGTSLSLPKMMSLNDAELTISYGAMDYVTLFLVIISTVFVLVAVIAILSATAKSVKEAGTMISPLMLVNVAISLIPMFGNAKNIELKQFFIPIYNSVMMMNGVFSSNYQMSQLAVTIVTNVVLTGVLAFGLTKMFGSEKIMFGK